MKRTRHKEPEGHPIQVVARRTGLTPDVIRVWERRYEAVAPRRTSTNRRLYSDEDIERLVLLRRAILGGRRIGEVARLDRGRLKEMVEADAAAAVEAPTPTAPGPPPRAATRHLRACLEAARNLDAEALTTHLSNATLALSAPVLLEGLLMPLMREIGDGWKNGDLRIAHEHLTSAIVRSFLGTLQNGHAGTEPRADLLVTTPAGQLHELGALMAAATASLDGWRVTYLGPNLPAEEIATAARERGSRAVALSIIHPTDDPRLPKELETLRRLLPNSVPLLVGGSGAQAYDAALRRVGALRPADMATLRERLEALRLGPS